MRLKSTLDFRLVEENDAGWVSLMRASQVQGLCKSQGGDWPVGRGETIDAT